MPAGRWWLPGAVIAAVATGLLVLSAWPGEAVPTVGTPVWWVLTVLLHAPMAVILPFLVGGLVERLGYFWRGRRAEQAGRLPGRLPKVCVQLPMFNEHAVARRAIEAACALMWPADRLTVQVLDDSTDADTRALVERICAEARARTGVDCHVVHRLGRHGYKAGALEVGRGRTDAEFLAIFDADFVPKRDYLLRMIPHFYDANGEPERGLGVVQAQWGHLNHDESALTRAQSLWVDDHHTLQMSWRSAMWRFVNFTGTAGVWRAEAIRRAGGWRAASLVEDCELSFRNLFAGYRSKFVKEVVAPAELPATYTAYKAQQKRWTQGWVQLQRLHLRRLATQYRCGPLKRLHLLYHMCVSWQWPAWAVWLLLLPFLILNDLWFGAFGGGAGLALYLLPTAVWALVATVLASVETRHTYADRAVPRRVARVLPYLVINAGMLPHQFSAFTEGLFGSMHSEFERTPKAGSGHERRRYHVKVHWPYVLAEAFFVAYQLSWAVLFALHGLILCALGAAFVAACVLYLAFFYGDHAGRVCFVIDRAKLGGTVRPWPVGPPEPAGSGRRAA